jgi:hypothetical protein
MRFADDRAGDRDPLTLAARQLVGVVIRPVCDVELPHRRDSRPARGSRGNAVELERKAHVLECIQPGEEVEVLEHVADRSATQLRPIRARRGREVEPVYEHLTACRLLEAARDRQERALAGAARAHDRRQLAPLDHEVDRVERVHLARPGAVDL